MFPRLSHQVRLARVDDESLFHCAATQQHAKTHIVAVSQGHFDWPLVVAEGNCSPNDIAFLLVPAGIGHYTLIKYRRFALDFEIATALLRMNRKCDPQLAIDMMRSEAECMQCRSS